LEKRGSLRGEGLGSDLDRLFDIKGGFGVGSLFLILCGI